MKKAFTLVEIIAIVAVIGVILAIAIPNLIVAINATRLQNFTVQTSLLARQLTEPGQRFHVDSVKDQVRPVRVRLSYYESGHPPIEFGVASWTSEDEAILIKDATVEFTM